MPKLFAIFASALLCSAADAQNTSCSAEACEEKWAGAATNSNLKNCVKDTVGEAI